MLVPRPPRINVPAEFLRLGYALVGRLGRGATSEVFEATHAATRRRVALKVALADIPFPERVSSRLQTAWNVGRGLRHPHIVATLDGGVLVDGRAWLAMERLEGQDLQHALDAQGSMAPGRAVWILRQVLDGLAVLHQRGAIHRDVKPENVFLCAGGPVADHVRLIDLGVVALAADDPERAHEVTGPVIMGTPLYLAPELARGCPPTPAADLYSAGAMLFHMLSGGPPYDGDDPSQVIERHLREPVPRLDPALGLPMVLTGLVERLLVKEPSERPGSAAEVIEALDGCLVALGAAPAIITGSPGAHVPAVPPAGVTSEWRRFAEVLIADVSYAWPPSARPPAVQAALEWLDGARTALAQSEAAAVTARARADGLARRRIEAQTRVEGRLRALGAALSTARIELRAATDALDQAAAARDTTDERYRESMSRLSALGAGPLGAVTPDDVLPVLARLRQLLAHRNKDEQRLREARAEEREAAEQVALLLAEKVELDRAYADLSLEEQDEGRRVESVAAVAADEVITAQRALENAALNLFLRYLELARFTPVPLG